MSENKITVIKQLFKKVPEKVRVMNNGKLEEMEVMQKKPVGTVEIKVTKAYFDEHLRHDERYSFPDEKRQKEIDAEAVAKQKEFDLKLKEATAKGEAAQKELADLKKQGNQG